MDIAGIQTQLAAILPPGTGGALLTFAQHPNAIPQTPAIVIGNPRGKSNTGSPQISSLTVPVRVYVARMGDEARTAALLTPIVNAVIAALAPWNSNGAYWTVIEQIDWDSSKFYDVAGVTYAAIDFDLQMQIHETVTTYGAH